MLFSTNAIVFEAFGTKATSQPSATMPGTEGQGDVPAPVTMSEFDPKRTSE
jgi:hypothetical protein